jgi:sensor histidine kinase YesM
VQELELKISRKDWISIFAIGIFFSVIVTSLLYFLLDLHFTGGLVFGAMLGATIVLFSMLFISSLNTFILPKISQGYWVGLAAFFSFLSGFLATFTTYFLAKTLGVVLIEKFANNLTAFAFMLGALTYIIGSLLYRFVTMSNQKEYNEMMLTQSRLKSLETQLNPHFLFNALNSLAELIHTDTDKADKALTQLSKFLRTGMQETTLFSIEEELLNVSRYIALENIRFSDKITLNIQCDEDIKTLRVPKFSIQLLVENALKHGFSSDLNDFYVAIKIQKQNSRIYIDVLNSGKSVTNEKFGIGLNNLNERLKLLCRGHVTLYDPKNTTYRISIGGCSENTTIRR